MRRRSAERLRRRAASVALALAAAGAPAAAAAPVTVILDPAGTTIRWTLRGFPDTVRGTFQLAGGALTFDTDSGVADGCLRVEARTGESGNATRDRKMHEQILETARYPVVALRPLHVDGALPAAGEGTLRLDGTLTLHGSTHPVSLPLRVTRQADRFTADAGLAIPYVAWGLADPSVFVFRASKTVELDLHAAGVVAPNATRIPACEP